MWSLLSAQSTPEKICIMWSLRGLSEFCPDGRGQLTFDQPFALHPEE
jgi:hypothetical protein